MSDSDEAFDEIAASLPELSTLDSGQEIAFLGADGVVRISGAEYIGWVQDLFRYVLVGPAVWFEGVNEFAAQPPAVVNAVVHDAYRMLSEYVLTQAQPIEVPKLLKLMHKMVIFCRRRQS